MSISSFPDRETFASYIVDLTNFYEENNNEVRMKEMYYIRDETANISSIFRAFLLKVVGADLGYKEYILKDNENFEYMNLALVASLGLLLTAIVVGKYPNAEFNRNGFILHNMLESSNTVLAFKQIEDVWKESINNKLFALTNYCEVMKGFYNGKYD